MTAKQKQCLLAFLGYDTGGVDGIWGPASRHALECCQEDLSLPPDGVWGPLTETAVLEAVYTYDDGPVAEDVTDNNVGHTGTFWDSIQHFTREEFECQCRYQEGASCDGFPVEMEEEAVRVFDEIRHRAGVPLTVVEDGGSGIRCPAHNARVGGVWNSEHLYGRAADLHPHGISPKELYCIAEEVTAELIPGRGGIGLYSWGVHVDTGKFSRWNG